MRKSHILSVFLAVVTFKPASPQAQVPAVAGSEALLAVIEAYVSGEEPGVSAEYSRALAQEFAKTGKFAVMDRDEVSRRFRSVLIMPLKRLHAERLSEVEKLIAEGDDLLYRDPKSAVEVLARARAELDAIAEGLATNERLREELFRTLMLLARSHLDAGNENRAVEVLRDVVRLFGDSADVSERRYHPKLVKLYQKVRKAMDAERTAVMTVQTPQPGCTAWLDGRPLEGATPATYERLYPGVHHVQVRCGSKESMIRRITLAPDQPLYLEVDVDFEMALTVSGDRLGLSFESKETLEQWLVPYAAKFGTLVNADLVVVHWFEGIGPKATLRSHLVSARTAEVVQSVNVQAPTIAVSMSSVQHTVRGLLGEQAFEVAEAGSQPKRWYECYWGWVASGVGVAALGTSVGLYAYYRHHRAEALKPGADPQLAKAHADKANSVRYWAPVTLGVGLAALAGGVALFVLSERNQTENEMEGEAFQGTYFSPVLLPSGALFSAGLAF